MSLPEPIPPVTGEAGRKLAEKLGLPRDLADPNAQPVELELPAATVKRIAQQACPDAHFNAEAVQQIALRAEHLIRELGAKAYNNARREQKKRVQPGHVEQAATPPTRAERREALAIHNDWLLEANEAYARTLRAAGIVPPALPPCPVVAE